MFAVVPSIKRALHRDLVRDPATHAWVLNLYRAGERHPQMTDDYFPVEHAPWPELAADLARHRDDERRHDRMYTKAIQRLYQPVVELSGADVFNRVICACTPVSFRVDAGDSASAVRLKVAHFLAHAHFLEKRITQSLTYHLEACERGGSEAVVPIVRSVFADEDRHVRYTREAVYELVDRKAAEDVMDVHRRAEAKANLLFSEAHVRECLRRFDSHVPRHRRLLYRACAVIMEEAGSHV